MSKLLRTELLTAIADAAKCERVAYARMLCVLQEVSNPALVTVNTKAQEAAAVGFAEEWAAAEVLGGRLKADLRMLDAGDDPLLEALRRTVTLLEQLTTPSVILAEKCVWAGCSETGPLVERFLLDGEAVKVCESHAIIGDANGHWNKKEA